VPTGDGGTGNGSGNNNEFNSPLWDVFTGSVPMGIFAQNPALLPPGFTTKGSIQFQLRF
jgi:hypothetical protein